MAVRLQAASWWLVIAKAETCSGSVPPTTSNQIVILVFPLTRMKKQTKRALKGLG
jgi:hypothetical protein